LDCLHFAVGFGAASWQIVSMIHIPTLIERKRDGGSLSQEEIRHLVAAFTSGEMPDYQMSALAMAIFFQGMSVAEVSSLTDAMLHSGEVFSWPEEAPTVVDKHSTGGIGDKTSLVLAPLLAELGLWVPMISGRGLGITGGTLDKLESIPGFSTQLDVKRVGEVLHELGCVMVGQTPTVCPADKKLYALRDVSGTVPSIPLITASIMSKKLAEGLDRLVLDVKYGSGAFMKTRQQAEALAASMVPVGEALGVRTRAVLNPMSEPTGCAVGNALEVAECVAVMQGGGPPDLVDLILDLAAEVSDASRDQMLALLADGSVWRRFQRMVTAQGGDAEVLETLTSRVHPAPVIHELKAEQSGTLTQMDAGVLGLAVLKLGAGRARASDGIDPAVGLDALLKTGTQVQAGDTLLRIHARTETAAKEAAHAITSGIEIR
jgi:pyrimidine-nucleoside phosphorylase